MGKRLTNNLGLKLISVFLAFFVWLAVVNIANTETDGSREVPLEIVNGSVLTASGKTYEIIGNVDTVTVSYKIRVQDSGSVSSSDFRAYVDLAEMYEPTGAVPVKIDVNNSRVSSVLARPSVVRVETEDLQRKQFELTAYLEGHAQSGYREGNVTISPTQVYVSGPVSLVGQISTVGISINVEGADSDMSGTLPIKCYDSNGNEIALDDRITLSRTEAEYSLPILRTKNLTLNFETPSGTVADGYRYTGIESSVNSVEVVGLKSDLANVTSITIPQSELNLSGATSDREVTIDLNEYLPEGAQLVGSDSQLTVTLKVEPLEERTFALSTSQISQVGASSQYSYQYDQDSIQVVIRGLAEDLDQLEEETLEAEVDVSSMEPGIHQASITFDLGAAYEVVSSDSLQIVVHDRPAGAPGEPEGSESEAASQEGSTSGTQGGNTSQSQSSHASETQNGSTSETQSGHTSQSQSASDGAGETGTERVSSEEE